MRQKTSSGFMQTQLNARIYVRVVYRWLCCQWLCRRPRPAASGHTRINFRLTNVILVAILFIISGTEDNIRDIKINITPTNIIFSPTSIQF